MTGPLVVLRQSPRWDQITRDEYRRTSRAFCLQVGRPPDQMNEVLDAWDGCFGISFFETRQKMKEIAGAALAAVRGARLADAATFAPGFAADGDRPVCFVDDDDWFAPDLGEHLSGLAGCDGALWTHVSFGFHNRLERFDPGATEWWCFTNNYAVTADYVHRCGVAGVMQHWAADKTFRKLRVRRLAAALSFANKHPASLVALERGLEGPLSGTSLGALVSGFVRGLEGVDDAALDGVRWARPYLDATQHHFSRVLASAR